MSKDWINRPSWSEIEEIANQSRSAAIPGPEKPENDKPRSTNNEKVRMILATAALASTLNSAGCAKPETVPTPVNPTPDNPSPTPTLVVKTPTPELIPTPVIENYGGTALDRSFIEQIASRGNGGLLDHQGMPSYLSVYLESPDNQYTLAQKTLFALSYMGSRVTQPGSKLISGSTPGVGIIEPIAVTPDLNLKSPQVFRQKIAGEGVSIFFSAEESLNGEELSKSSGDYLTILATLPDGRTVVMAENWVLDKATKKTSPYYHLLLISPTRLQEVKDKIGGFQIKNANWVPNQLDSESSKAIVDALPKVRESARIERELEKVTFVDFDATESVLLKKMLREVIRYDPLWGKNFSTENIVIKNNNRPELTQNIAVNNYDFSILIRDGFFVNNHPFDQAWNIPAFSLETLYWTNSCKLSHEFFHIFEFKNWPEFKGLSVINKQALAPSLVNRYEGEAVNHEIDTAKKILNAMTSGEIITSSKTKEEMQRYINGLITVRDALLSASK